jgi:hypothetical protein
MRWAHCGWLDGCCSSRRGRGAPGPTSSGCDTHHAEPLAICSMLEVSYCVDADWLDLFDVSSREIVAVKQGTSCTQCPTPQVLSWGCLDFTTWCTQSSTLCLWSLSSLSASRVCLCQPHASRPCTGSAALQCGLLSHLASVSPLNHSELIQVQTPKLQRPLLASLQFWAQHSVVRAFGQRGTSPQSYQVQRNPAAKLACSFTQPAPFTRPASIFPQS